MELSVDREQQERRSRRLWRISAILSCFIPLQILAQAHPVPEHPPQVIVESGRLEGQRLADTNTSVFLGVPYANQPIGFLRWQAPSAPLSWPEVRKVVKYTPACPQQPQTAAGNPRRNPEACLYLNVWMPRLQPRARQPVLVWMNNAGNADGPADLAGLGPALAQQGVVAVSVNYRLGVLGFFSHPALAAESPRRTSGNYGLQDQIAALQWVRHNIVAFGGDPKRVAIFGTLAGTRDVCSLLQSPPAQGLFWRAVLQTASCPDSTAPSLAQAETANAWLVSDLGLRSGPNELPELRAVPVDRLLKAAAADPKLSLEPVVDGWSLVGPSASAHVQISQAPKRDKIDEFAAELAGELGASPNATGMPQSH
jgi:para-nitrobenzyl esterase